MASNSQKQKDLNKLAKEVSAILSNFPPRKGKASPSPSPSPWPLPKLVPAQNGSGKNEECIDAYQAARIYGGHVQTRLITCPPQTKTVKEPITKGGVYSVYQHYYQSPA